MKCRSIFKLHKKRNKELNWTGDTDAAFNIIKKALEDNAILRYFDEIGENIIESDASVTVISGNQSQIFPEIRTLEMLSIV